MATHYTTLGVSPDVAQDELRRAYHREARRWHPDRSSERTGAEADRADEAMRRVNDAWRVLGEVESRRAYDRELKMAVSGATTLGGAVTVDAGVPRIDPRLLDPDFLAARRRVQQDEVEVRHAGVLRVITVVGFSALLIGIFIFTAYANDSSAPVVATTIPGPEIGVEAGSCVRQLSDGQLLNVPCSGSSDGRVIGAREVDGSCPAGTTRELLLPNGIVACLGS